MNVEWRAFLEQAGAVIAADETVHFGEPTMELRTALASNICSALSQQGLIAVRGPDSEAFLQGQLTCDIGQVTLERSLIGAYCTPKGRALACFRVFRRQEDGYYLELPRPLLEPTLARLRKYVMRSKTTLEDASDATVHIGVAGPQVTHFLAAQTPIADEAIPPGGVCQTDKLIIIRLPDRTPRFELHGTVEGLKPIWTELTRQCTPVSAEAWRLLDILAGIPVVHPETVEAFVPQMLNLDLLGGISFQKGCYTGQEIIARTHYLGKVKRRMVLARVDSPIPPRPGDPLFSTQAGPHQSAGQLADVAPRPDGGYAVLAVALLEFAEQGALQLGDVSGPMLRLEPLPYALTPGG